MPLSLFWSQRKRPFNCFNMVEYMSSRYKLTGKLGEGVHGIVLKAIDLTLNKEVAIKKVSLKTKHGDLSISTIREIKVLQNCDCKYVSIAFVSFIQQLFKNNNPSNS